MVSILICCIYIQLFITVIMSSKCNRPIDFNCNFDKTLAHCSCWRNERNFRWKIGTRVAFDGWHSIPRPKSVHNDSFAYVQRNGYIFSVQGFQSVFISTIIDCSNYPLSLSFWYWKTAIIPKIRVCTKTVKTNKTTCHLHIGGFQPQAWIHVTAFIPKQNESFVIHIEALNIHAIYDIVGMDDIVLATHTGHFCENTVKNNFCANCINFSHCTNYVVNSGNWSSVRDENCSRNNCKNGTFGVAHGPSPSNHVLVTKEEVHIHSTSFLEFFRLFPPNVSDTATLRVCVTTLHNCFYSKHGHSTSFFDKNWIKETLTLEPGTYKIFFVVSGLKEDDIIGIDDIEIIDRITGQNLCS